MTLAKRHGFTFVPVPRESPVVAAFIKAHIVAFNLPDDSRSVAEHWTAVCKPPGVYAIFGWRLLDDAGGVRVDVSDFYCYPSRLGTLAAYAALERIKTLSEERGVPVLTATPANNTKMMKAICRIFGVEGPSHIVHLYNPNVIEKVEVA
jgi:hypothetical protein